MKIQTALLLASVFILPTQALSAENARDFSQSSVKKSVAAAPAKTTKKLKMVTPIRKGNVSADPVVNSGPATVKKPTLPNRGRAMVGLGPNLTVSVRYEHDVCAVNQSPLGAGIFDARCDLIITVKNVGDTATSLAPNGAFKLNLWYINYKGEVKNGFRYISNLGINEEKVIIYRSSKLRSFKASTPFTAVVDRGHIVTESNENDNRAVFWLAL